MRKVFVDVGGFEGDASRAALDPIFGFSHVLCYEPVPSCADFIRSRIQDSRFEVRCEALADREGRATLFGPGTLAGSLYSDHQHTDQSAAIPCVLRRASTTISELLAGETQLYLKLNCEGAEIPILEDLFSTGIFGRIHSVLLDLDARKIPSLSERQARVEGKLATLPRRNWYVPEEVQFGWQSTFGGIRNWLRVAGATVPGWRSHAACMKYNLDLWRLGEFRGYYKFLLVRRLPQPLVRYYYAHLRAGPKS